MKLKSVEKLEGSKVCLEIEIEKSEYDAAVDTAYKQNVGKISVPGFRKGKAPRKMIERMYGENVFAEDAMNIAYPRAYESAVKESGVEPVEQAEIDITDFNDGCVNFKATVTVRPEVTLGEYKGLKAEKVKATVSDEDIDGEISRLAARNARLVSVTRAAKDGDTVIIDFEGFVDGTPFEGGKAEGHSLKIGSGQFIPGFEEQLVGSVAGSDIDVKVTFPTEYQAEELAGREAIFKVKVSEVKETEEPVIDDEFAKDVSECDTLDELKKSISAKILDSREKTADDAFMNSVMDKVVENMQAEVPEVMVETQLDHITEDFSNRVTSQGLTLESYLQMSNMDIETFRKNFRDSALRQVKINLALEKVAELEEIKIEEADIDAEYTKLAEQYDMPVERLRSYLPIDMMMHDMMIIKTTEFIRENAVAEDVKKAAAKKTPAKKAAAKSDDDDSEKKAPVKKAAAKKTPAKKAPAKKKEDAE
ncbi:MAG: trigger factor [Clostridia bacterium]